MLRKFIIATAYLVSMLRGCGWVCPQLLRRRSRLQLSEAAGEAAGEVVTLDYYWIGNGGYRSARAG